MAKRGGGETVGTINVKVEVEADEASLENLTAAVEGAVGSAAGGSKTARAASSPRDAAPKATSTETKVTAKIANNIAKDIQTAINTGTAFNLNLNIEHIRDQIATALKGPFKISLDVEGGEHHAPGRARDATPSSEVSRQPPTPEVTQRSRQFANQISELHALLTQGFDKAGKSFGQGADSLEDKIAEIVSHFGAKKFDDLINPKTGAGLLSQSSLTSKHGLPEDFAKGIQALIRDDFASGTGDQKRYSDARALISYVAKWLDTAPAGAMPGQQKQAEPPPTVQPTAVAQAARQVREAISPEEIAKARREGDAQRAARFKVNDFESGVDLTTPTTLGRRRSHVARRFSPAQMSRAGRWIEQIDEAITQLIETDPQRGEQVANTSTGLVKAKPMTASTQARLKKLGVFRNFIVRQLEFNEQIEAAAERTYVPTDLDAQISTFDAAGRRMGTRRGKAPTATSLPRGSSGQYVVDPGASRLEPIRGVDPEADARAVQQLGLRDRADIRRLGKRVPIMDIGGEPFDLNPYLNRMAGPGNAYRNVFEHTEKGKDARLVSLEVPEGDEFGEQLLAEKRRPGRAQSIPGLEGKYEYLTPREAMTRDVIKDATAGKSAGAADAIAKQIRAALESTPVKTEIGRAIWVGANLGEGGQTETKRGVGKASMVHTGDVTSGMRGLMESIDFADSFIDQWTKELESISAEIDQRVAEGKPTTKLERRGSKLTAMLEQTAIARSIAAATLNDLQATLTPEQARVAAAANKAGSGAYRDRIEAGYGDDDRQKAERRYYSPVEYGSRLNNRIANRELPSQEGLQKALMSRFFETGGNFVRAGSGKGTDEVLKSAQVLREIAFGPGGNSQQPSRQGGLFHELTSPEAMKGMGRDERKEAKEYIRQTLMDLVGNEQFGQDLIAEELDAAERRRTGRPLRRTQSDLRRGLSGEGEYRIAPPGLLGSIKGSIAYEESLGPDHDPSHGAVGELGKIGSSHQDLAGLREQLAQLEQLMAVEGEGNWQAQMRRFRGTGGEGYVTGDEEGALASELAGRYGVSTVPGGPTGRYSAFEERYASAGAMGFDLAGGGGGGGRGGRGGGGGGAAGGGGGGRFSGTAIPVLVTNWPEGWGGGMGGGSDKAADPFASFPKINYAKDMSEAPFSSRQSGAETKGKAAKPIRYVRPITETKTAAERYREREEKAYARLFDQQDRVSSRDAVVAEQNRKRAVRGYNRSVRPPESRDSRQGMYEKLFNPVLDAAEKAEANRYKINYIPEIKGSTTIPLSVNRSEQSLNRQRERQEASDTRDRAAQARARVAEARAQRRTARINDPIGFATEQDLQDNRQRELRGQLRSINRSIPRRGFGASLTDLATQSISRLFGNPLEKQLEAGDLAAREAAEISQASTKRAQISVSRRGVATQIRNARAAAVPLGPGFQGPVLPPGSVEPLVQQFRDLTTAGKQQNTVIRESTKRFEGFHKEATNASTVLKSFSAAGVGGIVSAVAGSLSFAVANVITGPLLQATSEVVAAVGDRALGNVAEINNIRSGLGQSTREAGGRSETAVAQLATSSGLASSLFKQLGPNLATVAQVEAGNNALNDQLNIFRTEEDARRRGVSAGVTETLGGIGGSFIGGTAPAAETIGSFLGEVDPKSFFGDQKKEQARLEFRVSEINQTLDKAGTAVAHFSATIKFSDEVVAKQVDELRLAGTPEELITPLRLGSVSAVGPNGEAASGESLLRAIEQTVINAPKPEPEAFLAANRDALRAQLFSEDASRDLSLATVDPQREAIGLALQGFGGSGKGTPSARDGINLAGTSEKQQKALNKELTQTQKLYDDINQDVTSGLDAAKSFVTEQLGAGPGLEFASALQNASAAAKEISGIQIGIQTKQAAYQAAQFTFQIDLAKRSLADAKGLVSGVGSSLGAVERQIYDLNRQSQSLSLGQSQKQINFKQAVAGFTSPGLTGEEREANIEAAKLEADYAQKQLDIQKKLFGLGGKQFTITASRNVKDLVRQIGLLERGRTISLQTASAEKKIRALSVTVEKEQKKVERYYSAAEQRAGDLIQIQANVIAATGKGIRTIGALVVKEFADRLNEIADIAGNIGTQLPPKNPDAADRRSSGGKDGDPTTDYALGGVGTVNGATSIGKGVMGEAGGEAWAILRSPHQLITPMNSGGGDTIQIIVQGNKFNSQEDEALMLRKITDAVTAAQARKLALLGGRPTR